MAYPSYKLCSASDSWMQSIADENLVFETHVQCMAECEFELVCLLIPGITISCRKKKIISKKFSFVQTLIEAAKINHVIIELSDKSFFPMILIFIFHQKI